MLSMAETSSFDITSPVDFAEVDNALNQARKEIGQRYDFKGATAEMTLNAGEKTLTLLADDEMKMKAVWEIVQTRLTRRGETVKFIKDQKLKKVQAAIQGDQLRVSSPSKDELQSAMQFLRGHDFGVSLHFGNYR